LHRRTIAIKTPDELDKMRVAGRLAAEVLEMIGPHVKAGVSTGELDDLIYAHVRDHQHAIPAPLNYGGIVGGLFSFNELSKSVCKLSAHGVHYFVQGVLLFTNLKGIPVGIPFCGFPKSVCISVNEEVCHGIPGKRVLNSGDIVNIDVTVIKHGYHGDTSKIFTVGPISPEAEKLVEVTRECLFLGMLAVRPGVQIGDIGQIIQSHAEANGMGVVREFTGHGIGE
jgi:methionyl aminopeptidase